HALRGRPVLFPNFSLGEEYEHAPPATNRQISPYLPSGRFRTGLPVEGLAIERGDLFYAGVSLDIENYCTVSLFFEQAYL
ncbi:hypothetical protein ACTMMM_11060, partial [Escherichia coli]